MARLPTDITGRMVRHIFDLRRLENDLVFRSGTVLNRAEVEAVAALIREDLGSVVRFETTQRALGRVMDRVNRIIRDAISELEKRVRGEMRELALMESDFAGVTIERAIGSERAAGINVLTGKGALSSDLLKRIIEEEPLRGSPLDQWWKDQAVSVRGEFRRRLQIGMVEGESTAELVRRIRGTRAFNFRDGVFRGLQKRHVTALVRTAVNQISNRSQLETYKANKRVTSSYEYIATLDDRTTDICISLDGAVFEYDDPKKRMPPQHPNCRSRIAPVINYDKLGLEAPKEGTRASKDGPVKASVKYKDWIITQPKSVQNKVFGPARAELLRRGKITVSDLVRNDGRRLTLEQLRERVNL